MKALVLSDSHGSFQSIMNAVESEKDISLIIFAGDIQRDADDIAAAYPDIPFEYVLGNNEYFSALNMAETIPQIAVIMILAPFIKKFGINFTVAYR